MGDKFKQMFKIQVYLYWTEIKSHSWDQISDLKIRTESFNVRTWNKNNAAFRFDLVFNWYLAPLRLIEKNSKPTRTWPKRKHRRKRGYRESQFPGTYREFHNDGCSLERGKAQALIHQKYIIIMSEQWLGTCLWIERCFVTNSNFSETEDSAG